MATMLEPLARHPAMIQYLAYVSTANGRDKFFRTIQYFARFVQWYVYRTNHPAATVTDWKNIMNTFALIRRGMRLGKFIEHWQLAVVYLTAKGRAGQDIRTYLQAGRQLGYMGYLIFDNLCFPYWLKLSGWNAARVKRFQEAAYRAWLFGLSCNIVLGLYSIYSTNLAIRAKQQNADAEKAVEVKRLEKERSATYLQLLSDLCDCTVPSKGLNLIDFDDGIVGIAGTISSIIGIRVQWQKVAPAIKQD